MKNIKVLAVAIFAILFTVSSFGFSKEKYKQIENNLLVGLNTDNQGLQVSCAFFLGELKSEKAVIPLLKMLKSGKTEEERIIAALSLSKIQTERALFAVKQRIKFDDSERVQRLCELFYNCCMSNKNMGNVIVEPIKVVDLNIDLNQEFSGVSLADFAK